MKKNLYLFVLLMAISSFASSALAEGDGYGANNGGNSGTAVTVTTAAQLQTYATSTAAYNITVSGTINLGTNGVVSLNSNKTLKGANTSATIIGTINITGKSNVIVKNLNISAPTGAAGDNDGIQIRGGSTGILITKCSIYDCTDGGLDVTHGGATATVSWCKFYYTRDNGHNFACLIGSSDTDTGTYKLTYHHNWWAQGCQQRMSASRFGPTHFYNNYFSCSGNSYCTTSRNVGEMLAQNNYYDGVNNPLAKVESGKLKTSGNTFNNCTGTQASSSDAVFTPSYSYSLTATASVPGTVKGGAGNVAQSSSAITSGAIYSVINKNSGKGLDVQDASTANGGNIQQYNYVGATNQQFRITSIDGTYYSIVNINSSKGLDVAASSTANGANIQQWNYSGGANQQFKFVSTGDGYYQIVNKNSGKCLDVADLSTSNGANVQQYNCGSGLNQRWQLNMIALKSGTLEIMKEEVAEKASGILIYPSPATNGTFTVKLNGVNTEDIATINIYDLKGQLVFNETFTGSNTISGLNKGMYMINVVSATDIFTNKILVK